MENLFQNPPLAAELLLTLFSIGWFGFSLSEAPVGIPSPP
jgi:hypothetical protein